MPRFRRIALSALVAAALAAAVASVARADQAAAAPAVPQRPALTVDWIFSEEGRSVGRLPATTWLRSGGLLLLDNRVPDAEATFERIDPVTGARRPVLDMARAIANLKALAGDDVDVKKTLPWPLAFDADGARALYVFKNDVFLLDLAAAAFRRLTMTDAAEKSVGFSPDGTRVAFVRSNDLYVVDLASVRETRLTRDGADTILNGTLSWVYWEEIFARRDIGYWWSPDSSALAFLRSDESPVAVSHFVDFAPATPRVIRQRYPRPARRTRWSASASSPPMAAERHGLARSLTCIRTSNPKT